MRGRLGGLLTTLLTALLLGSCVGEDPAGAPGTSADVSTTEADSETTDPEPVGSSESEPEDQAAEEAGSEPSSPPIVVRLSGDFGAALALADPGSESLGLPFELPEGILEGVAVEDSGLIALLREGNEFVTVRTGAGGTVESLDQGILGEESIGVPAASLSPDGTHLAVARCEKLFTCLLSVGPTDGEQVVMTDLIEVVDEFNPAGLRLTELGWFPESDALLVAAPDIESWEVDDDGMLTQGPYRFARVDVDDGEVSDLGRMDSFVSSIAVSPEGDRFAVGRVVDEPEGLPVGEIVVRDFDGENEAVVAQGINPVWSPDGQQIAYSSDGATYLVPAAGGTPQPVASSLVRVSPVAWPAKGLSVEPPRVSTEPADQHADLFEQLNRVLRSDRAPASDAFFPGSIAAEWAAVLIDFGVWEGLECPPAFPDCVLPTERGPAVSVRPNPPGVLLDGRFGSRSASLGPQMITEVEMTNGLLSDWVSDRFGRVSDFYTPMWEGVSDFRTFLSLQLRGVVRTPDLHRAIVTIVYPPLWTQVENLRIQLVVDGEVRSGPALVSLAHPLLDTVEMILQPPPPEGLAESEEGIRTTLALPLESDDVTRLRVTVVSEGEERVLELSLEDVP